MGAASGSGRTGPEYAEHGAESQGQARMGTKPLLGRLVSDDGRFLRQFSVPASQPELRAWPDDMTSWASEPQRPRTQPFSLSLSL